MSQNAYDMTVIVPVYNGEDLLERCVSSLDAQRVSQRCFEVIFVNDGSTDGSGSLCHALADARPNYVVIDQENRGVSAARNEGIRHARGRYIMFLDVDDYLSAGAIGQLVLTFDRYRNEIDLLSYNVTYEVLETGRRRPHKRQTWLTSTGLYSLQEYPYLAQSTPTVCIRNDGDATPLFPTELRMGEDQYFNTQVLARRGVLGFCAEATYYHVQHEGSATSRWDAPRYAFEDMMCLYHMLLDLAISQPAMADYAHALILYNVAWRVRRDLLLPDFGDKETRARNHGRLAEVLHAIPGTAWAANPYITDIQRVWLAQRYDLEDIMPDEVEPPVLKVYWLMRKSACLRMKALVYGPTISTDVPLLFEPHLTSMPRDTLACAVEPADRSLVVDGVKVPTWYVETELPAMDGEPYTVTFTGRMGDTTIDAFDLRVDECRTNGRRITADSREFGDRRLFIGQSSLRVGTIKGMPAWTMPVVKRVATLKDGSRTGDFDVEAVTKLRAALPRAVRSWRKKRIWLYVDAAEALAADATLDDGVERIDLATVEGEVERIAAFFAAERVVSTCTELEDLLPCDKRTWRRLTDFAGDQTFVLAAGAGLHGTPYDIRTGDCPQKAAQSTPASEDCPQKAAQSAPVPRPPVQSHLDPSDVHRLLDAEGARASEAGYDYVFSVIVPVYNTEAYLEECIQSVMHQTVGFANTQLILVDDGSADGSAAICERYAQAYPSNITFVQQSNAGVSAARNCGLAQARGLWVNYLDSDDLWSEGAFAAALEFHESHPDVRIVTLRHWFFDAQKGPHALDYKFATDRVVHIAEDPAFPQLSFSNAFVEAPLMEGVHFDPTLTVSEDFAEVNEVIMDVSAFGICSKEAYLYRKRVGGGSAIDTSRQQLGYYTQTPTLCYQKLFDSSARRFGEVIPYIQHCVMYDLQWRLRAPVSPVLSPEQVAAYRATLVGLVEQIDDDVVMAQRRMNFDQRLYALSLKHGVAMGDIVQDSMRVAGRLVWPGPDGSVVLEQIDQLDARLVVEFLDVHDGRVTIEGHATLLGTCASSQMRIEFGAEGTAPSAPAVGQRLSLLPQPSGTTDVAWHEATYVERPDKSERVAFPEDAYNKLGFCVTIPWDGGRCELVARIQLGSTCLDVGLSFGKFVGLDASLAHTYWDTQGVIWTCGPQMPHVPTRDARGTSPASVRALILERSTLARNAQCETALRAELLRTVPRGYRFVAWRAIGCQARARRQKSRKKVWLIFDRPTKAGDNAEALFSYLSTHPQPDVEPVFALARSSADWDRVAAMGRVVEFGSVAYRRLFFRANLIVSSSADAWASNPFGGRRKYFKDLFGFKFAFLQHGVIKDDLSEWLNRYNKNLDMFVTSAQREYQSILDGAYGYGSDVVKLTGLPRHDKLLAAAASAAKNQQTQRIVYLMPTWRSDLSLSIDPKTGQRPANPRFTDSNFFAFYDALIGDARLNQALADHGYELRFVLHPALELEAPKFNPGPSVRVLGRCDYQQAFIEGSLLVTDYSSVAFDFALLRKPIVYTQFDREAFFAGHSYKAGYFDYEVDGFGPVCATLEQTIDVIVGLLQDAGHEPASQATPAFGQPVMAPLYQARVDEFFGEQPACRCAAVTEVLKDMSKRSDA